MSMRSTAVRDYTQPSDRYSKITGFSMRYLNLLPDIFVKPVGILSRFNQCIVSNLSTCFLWAFPSLFSPLHSGLAHKVFRKWSTPMFFLLNLPGIRSEWVKSDRISCSKWVLYILIYLMGGNGFSRVVKLVLQHEIKRFDENLVSVVYITDGHYIKSKLCIAAYVLCSVLIRFECSVMPTCQQHAGKM